ncbi:uncharacterized protein LOC125494677 [Beta vulgaris subsp. vulgaris]|uniref:uncharacterized protein LOC125494677 n=1 Tax=Beta vulgaris subsp. vulgaris TaxID=3555 RepID=UPI0020373E10|nr:uncharacterized protein LOC125494677 [Beta vulgaris subsp. vulgaris]
MVAWNVRCLNDPIKIKETKVFLQHHGVDFCALFETRVRDHKASTVQKKLGSNWSWEDNYGFSPRGRIWIGWKPGVVSVTVVRKTEQCVMVQVASLEQNQLFSLIVVYGLHTIANRRQLWVDLREMVDNVAFPYLTIGDFNAVSQASDRIIGTLVSEAETVDFSNFLMEVEYLAEGISDHTPLLVSFYTIHERGGRPFRFNNILAKDVNFLATAHIKVEEFRAQLANVQSRMVNCGDVELHLEEKDLAANGVMLTTRDKIQAEIIDFYTKLMDTRAGSLPSIDLHTIRAGSRDGNGSAGRQLSYDARVLLSQPVTHAEIDQALFIIDDNKAPGLDGFNALFFTNSWEIIKNDVYEGIEDFFHYAFIHHPINITAIILVPKIAHALQAKDFRPIACCSVLYKIIAKILTIILHSVISEVVNPSQDGFIPGRAINDNILLATELIKGYTRLHSADVRSVTKIMVAFTKFSQASGLEASLEKSNIYLAGVSAHEATLLAEAVQLTIGDLPFKYLGVSLSSKKLNYSQCKILIDKITERAQGWVTKTLSYAGRLPLVRSGLSTMQHYWFQIFPLSKKLIRVVEAVCRKHLWTRKTLDSKKAPIAWSQFYKPRAAGVGI